ncbi:unnamed protein product [Pieris brassicae]|uniref:AAA+ ATPase domain-containing protein n=1 Tax=Pieris brassicae TaxID=7116 RepID=A0A9P0THH1_PIEBR|nr:unnamed protein product [Pieris brassicae]
MLGIPLHVEVVKRNQSVATVEHIIEIVHSYLSNFTSLKPGLTLSETDLEGQELKSHVFSVTFCNIGHDTEVTMTDCEIIYHVYTLNTFGSQTDTMTDESSGEDIHAADVWALPTQEFHGLWESLIYDSKLKEETLRFVETAFEFSDRCVNPNIIGCNRVVLLHGPPGTGKTSLCRALAQKLAIRMADRYPRAHLLEINGHGLFSKWFSESGKLVAKVFDRIREIAEDKRLLACILIDEIESLAHARRAAMAGLEPSDSIRAVNAILTQLDRLKRYPNVLVLTTSNVTGAIDVAFVDRADIKRLVGPPSARAAYDILKGCCEELMAHEIIVPRDLLFGLQVLETANFSDTEGSRSSLRLREVACAAAAAKMSARSLRRLPFLARALYATRQTDLLNFVDALQSALRQNLEDTQTLNDEN